MIRPRGKSILWGVVLLLACMRAHAGYPEAQLCLALNIYHEANTEPWDGQMAVALVTRNRARINGTSLCWEVFRDQQFTWTEDRRKRQYLPKGAAWQQSLKLAREALKTTEDFTGGATEYHLDTITPWWAKYMEFTGKWGRHIFYRARPKQDILSAHKGG
jgi:N-acetylmuramoyl-L-alanine amidase